MAPASHSRAVTAGAVPQRRATEDDRKIAGCSATYLPELEQIQCAGLNSQTVHQPLVDPASFTIPDMASPAQSAVDAIVAHGAALLLRFPHRAERIIPGASAMTRDEIATIVWRLLPRVTDMNRALGLRQLLRASQQAGFGPAWSIYRAEREQEMQNA